MADTYYLGIMPAGTDPIANPELVQYFPDGSKPQEVTPADGSWEYARLRVAEGALSVGAASLYDFTTPPGFAPTSLTVMAVTNGWEVTIPNGVNTANVRWSVASLVETEAARFSVDIEILDDFVLNELTVIAALNTSLTSKRGDEQGIVGSAGDIVAADGLYVGPLDAGETTRYVGTRFNVQGTGERKFIIRNPDLVRA